MNTFFNTLKHETIAAREDMLNAPVIGLCQQGGITLPIYVSFLTQAYHHVKHTVPLLMACGGKLDSEYEWVRKALAEYIEEEYGHQEWILRDIKHCGGDVDAVRHNTGIGAVCEPIELMVSYLYHQIDRQNPMGFFGMVWVLEGTSVGIGALIAKQIQTTLKLESKALSYLLSHCELDQDHIKFFETLMNQVTKLEDQKAIIHSANRVYSLYGQMLRKLHP
ncbi:TenA family transcriptional regulator [Thorsellia anophelis]|uniref:Iron-containing redox enzyme n=1 Tax=Thorsellia anophelis DSM 18579 TaxID=1123402 RepID=A0A1I0EXG9_9GAMM|nr:iron-containing redox enzyme family protein [Thorsellia anophelis]SET50326.1 Iron-containing redox enzyme [Thorsellia anophelis DSM 18579]